jgi:hypothetical protein
LLFIILINRLVLSHGSVIADPTQTDQAPASNAWLTSSGELNLPSAITGTAQLLEHDLTKSRSGSSGTGPFV